MGERCDAKIRPMRPLNEVEIQCEDDVGHGESHRGTLRGYAYPGSETVISWREEDRRTFRGIFIPCGDNDAPCLLPWHHAGEHVE